MANPLPLVALPTDDLIWDAGLSMTNEDPVCPVGNAQGIRPTPPAKSTTNSTTFTIAPATGGTPLYLALFNTNAETGTFDGNAITFPGIELDGQRLHPMLDLRTITVGSPPWSLSVSKASGVVWVGRIVLVTAIHDLPLKYGLQIGRRRPGVVRIVTRLGTILRQDSTIRTRWARGVVDIIAAESMLGTLDASAKGDVLPFLFVPDEAVNDAWFVTGAPEFEKGYPDYDVREIPLTFDEVSNGPPNG